MNIKEMKLVDKALLNFVKKSNTLILDVKTDGKVLLGNGFIALTCDIKFLNVDVKAEIYKKLEVIPSVDNPKSLRTNGFGGGASEYNNQSIWDMFGDKFDVVYEDTGLLCNDACMIFATKTDDKINYKFINKEFYVFAKTLCLGSQIMSKEVSILTPLRMTDSIFGVIFCTRRRNIPEYLKQTKIKNGEGKQ